MSEHSDGLVIQRDMPRLAGLRGRPFHGKELVGEVDGGPPQLEELTASKSGVHRQEHGGRQVIPEVRQGR